jgi:hypothetical protein
MTDPLWQYARNGVQQGPVSFEQLRQLAAQGAVQHGDLVWQAGTAQWVAAASVPGLFAPGAPPPLPVNYYVPLPAPGPDLGQNAGMRMLLPVGRSVWAIIAGYLGLFSLIIFPAPFAIIVGIIAVIDIKRHPDRHGMGRAIFGIVMGAVMTVVAIVLLAFAGR